MKKILLFGLVLTLFATVASAQHTSGDRFRRHRIEKGIRSGDMTRHEMRKLHRHHHAYKMEKRRALRDGRITNRERHRLQKMKRHDSRQVYRYKHNQHRRFI